LSQEKSFDELKGEMEARINALEQERGTLLAEIPRLKERVTLIRLEDKANALESEVLALKSEKSTLEEEITRYAQAHQPQANA